MKLISNRQSPESTQPGPAQGGAPIDDIVEPETAEPTTRQSGDQDLSAAFMPKNTAADSSDADASAKGAVQSPGETHTGAHDGSKPQPTEITWRWAIENDVRALQLLHFQAEIALGREVYLRELSFPANGQTIGGVPELSFPGVIAVAEKDGQIIGGMSIEDSITATLIGMDAEVLESAGKVIIPLIVEKVALRRGIRLLHSSLPTQFATDLGGALQKAGFHGEREAISYRMELNEDDSNSAKRNIQ
jgi:hypothetical protein